MSGAVIANLSEESDALHLWQLVNCPDEVYDNTIILRLKTNIVILVPKYLKSIEFLLSELPSSSESKAKDIFWGTEVDIFHVDQGVQSVVFIDRNILIVQETSQKSYFIRCFQPGGKHFWERLYLQVKIYFMFFASNLLRLYSFMIMIFFVIVG